MTQKYTFELKRGRTKKVITIPSNATYADFDDEICEAYGYSTHDHCRAFFIGKPWVGVQLATINPDGSGDNEEDKIDPLVTKEKISYVYDFGDDIQHQVKFLQ